MDINIETVTPKQAEKYLQFNTSNRNLRKGLVVQYARDMANGHWKMTHQGIAFNCDGTLLDGQHRLMAIIESGVTVKMIVARGVDSHSQLVMDDHAKRNAGDALTLERGERVSNRDVAIIRAAVSLQGQFYMRRAGMLTKTEINELIDIFRDALCFTSTFEGRKYRGVAAAPVWGAIALSWFYVEDLDRLAMFCSILCGIDMARYDVDSAPCILRDWLLRTGAKCSVKRAEAFRKTQRAIVAFVNRQKLDKLYATTVYYQWPLVDPIR